MKNKKNFEGTVYRYQLNVPGDENDGKIYVGCTRDEKGRRQNWLNPKNKNYGGEKISAAREKYPPNEPCWDYKILEQRTFSDKEECEKWMNEREEYYINTFDSVNNGFNSSAGGTGNKGVKFSNEHKERISKNHRKYQSDETKKKISESNKGRIVSEETKAKISKGNKGKKRTEEQKQAQSAQRKGKVPSAALAASKKWHEENPGGYWGNHPLPPSARANMKAAQQNAGTKIKATNAEGKILAFPTMSDAGKYFKTSAGLILYYSGRKQSIHKFGYYLEKITPDEYDELTSGIA